MGQSSGGEAARRWAQTLGRWEIPEEILAAAPQPPWGFPPELFSASAAAALAEEAPSPSQRRASEAIPDGGVVLDVGVGGGAASLPLAPPAALLVGVDESEDMLDSFRAAARDRGVAHQVILGRWPGVAGSAPVADVVVCHHVAYNVSQLGPFLLALDRRARRRAVVEVTEKHPLAVLNPLWRALHGVERPEGPTAADALAVAREAGLGARVESFERASRWAEARPEAVVAFARRRLCVGPERDGEIAGLLGTTDWRSPRTMVTLWWDASGGGTSAGPYLSFPPR